LRNLTFLNLQATNVTDAVVEELAKFPKLKEVQVGFTDVSEEGIAKLKEMRPEMTVRD